MCQRAPDARASPLSYLGTGAGPPQPPSLPVTSCYHQRRRSHTFCAGPVVQQWSKIMQLPLGFAAVVLTVVACGGRLDPNAPRPNGRLTDRMTGMTRGAETDGPARR